MDYPFAQIAVDAPVVGYSANCGNLSAAVGPFAVDEGLIPAPLDGDALVRIHNTNTGKVIKSRFPVRGRRAVVAGDLALPGVPGTGAPVRLDFLDPAGSRTGALLPTQRPVDVLCLPAGARSAPSRSARATRWSSSPQTRSASPLPSTRTPSTRTPR